MDAFYALITELKRSQAPHLLQNLRGSCVMKIRETFGQMSQDLHSDALSKLVRLMLDHLPDTPQFELVACNLVEDVCFANGISNSSRREALSIVSNHPSPLADSLQISLAQPLFESITES